jgi:DNA-binding response OmpR family regulator
MKTRKWRKEMEYNYERREIYIPGKRLRTQRHITLTQKENVVFSLLWINKKGSKTFEELSKVLYGTSQPTNYDKNNIRRIVHRLKQKGIKIESMYGYGYKLGGN